ncbi:hypothetical protein BJV82DRAFT_585256 [Fennellomyces sp. T-0311]|nr:hypothetical protein BJV82DRAFT_585256 [Fennellomyces sp. T-0311]
MTTTTERIYVIGGTGNVGTATVKELLKNKVLVTVYTRSPEKAKTVFGDDSNLTVVQGELADLKPFEDTIAGHTRLFLLLSPDNVFNFPKYKVAIAEKAYAAGVKQIVHNSSISTIFPWRSSVIGEANRRSEEGIVNIPNRGAYVAIRAARFFINHLTVEFNSIKFANAIVDTIDPDIEQAWTSTNDVGLVAANILQEPVEKHGDAVYELIGDVVNSADRAEILTKALGRKISYIKTTPEEKYKTLIEKAGLPHILAYEFLKENTAPVQVTPGFSILLKRKPETLAQWLEANKSLLL